MTAPVGKPELAAGVSLRNGRVLLQFSTSCTWMELTADQADALGIALRHMASRLREATEKPS